MTPGVDSAIYDHVLEATVIITGLDDDGERVEKGSGFFIAPGLVLSCAHVVAKATDPQVRWKGEEHVPALVPDPRFDALDLALLLVEAGSSSCVPVTLDEPATGHEVWVPGIAAIRTGRPERFPSHLRIAGLSDPAVGLYRLEDGQISQGMSGGPVLDLTTYEVCGYVKSEQTTGPTAGGWFCALRQVFDLIGETVYDANLRTRPGSLAALRRRQDQLDRQAESIVHCLEGNQGARSALRARLRDDGRPTDLVAEEFFGEWAARHLFELDFGHLVAILESLGDFLPADHVKRIYLQVVSCLAEGGSAVWVPAAAAAALQAEVGLPEPRVVQLAADHDYSVDALLLRAFAIARYRVAGPSSAGPQDETFGDLVANFLVLAGHMGWAEADKWEPEAEREKIRGYLLEQRRFALVVSAQPPDGPWLRELALRFKGFPLIVRGRGLPAAPDSDELVLYLRPPIEPRSEQRALFFLRELVR